MVIGILYRFDTVFFFRDFSVSVGKGHTAHSHLRYFDIPQHSLFQIFLRALMNVWMPKDLSAEFLEIQDEYLQEENKRAGITDIESLKPIESDSRIFLWQGDMTTLKVDAITNPANSALLGCFSPLHNCADKSTHIRITHPLNYIMASC